MILSNNFKKIDFGNIKHFFIKHVTIKKLFILLAMALPVAWGFYMVLNYGVNCLFGDEFDFVQILRLYDNGELSVKDLFMPHNAHIMPTNYMLALVIGKLTNMNSIAYMLVSQLFAAVSFIVCARYLCKHIDNFCFRVMMIFVIGCIVFNVSQWENILWGFQMAWYLIVLCVVICAYCLFLIYNNKDKTRYFIWFIVFATISTYSSMHGMFVWLASGFIIIAVMNTKKLPLNRVVIFFSTGIAEMIIYFIIYLNNSGDRPGGVNITGIIENYLSAIGSPILPMLKGDHSDLAQRLGLVILCLSVFVIIHGIVSKTLVKNIFPAILIVFGHLFALSVSVVRPLPLSSRYLTCSFTIVIGLIIFACDYMLNYKNTIPSMLCFSIFMTGYVINNLEGIGQLEAIKNRQEYINEVFSRVEILNSDKVSSKVAFIMKDRLDFLDEHNYNLFHRHSTDYISLKKLYGEPKSMESFVTDTFVIDDNMITISGWAFCSEHMVPFDEMYLVIGNELFSISYSMERPDVASVFGTDAVMHVGYNIQQPNLFDDEYYSNIRLVGIHDGVFYEGAINQ